MLTKIISILGLISAGLLSPVYWYGLLSWKAACNQANSILSGIFEGLNKVRAPPRLVSIGGVIQIFQQSSPTF